MSSSLPGTLIPQAFANSADVIAAASAKYATASSAMAALHTRPLPAYKSLPEHACESHEINTDARPCTLPDGFSLRPTPPDASIANFSAQAYPARTCNSSWKSNLHVLVMGEGYAPIVGRGLRLAHTPCTLALEIMYSSYSIFFDQSLLSAPGVQFYPAFVERHPEDVNHYTKQDSDYTRLQNVIPATPPGAYLAFGRLAGTMAVKPNRHGGLQSSIKDHPVVSGERLFPASFFDACHTKVTGAMQEGGIGFLVFRPDYDLFGIDAENHHARGQLVPMYFRCAYGPEALHSISQQQIIVNEALQFALANSPRDVFGRPFVTVVHTMDPVCIPAATMAAAFEIDKRVNACDVRFVTRWNLAMELCATLGWESAWQEAGYQCSMGEHVEACGGVWSDTEVLTIEISGAVTQEPAMAQTVMYTTEQRTFAPDEIKTVYAAYVTAKTRAQHRFEHSACSPVMYYTAPPDVSAFGDSPVVVFGVMLCIRLGVRKAMHAQSSFERRLCRRTAGDIGTRLMCDMMLFNPVLAVTPCTSECMLSLFTDKAPGLLNVRSACKGVPAVATSTSDHRRIKNAHACIAGMEIFTLDSSKDKVPKRAVAPVPELTLEQANANVMLRALLRGGRTVYDVSGVEASIYDPMHKCQTIVAGTRHSWPVKGAILYNRIMRPKTAEYPWGLFDESVTTEQRQAALDFLFPPDYNSAACQIYSSTGKWADPATTHRKWKKPYGVDVSVMHRAMWWWYSYPAFITDKTHPTAIDIWRLKMLAEAEVHWMGRWGRVIRQLLNKRRRKVRIDYPRAVFRNYYCLLNRVEGAPIAPMALSTINVFQHNLILGEQQVVAASSTADDDGGPCSEDDDEECVEDESEEEDDDEEEDYSANPLAMLYGSVQNDVFEVTSRAGVSADSRKRVCL